jgi:hypothetical protein
MSERRVILLIEEVLKSPVSSRCKHRVFDSSTQLLCMYVSSNIFTCTANPIIPAPAAFLRWCILQEVVCMYSLLSGLRACILLRVAVPYHIQNLSIAFSDFWSVGSYSIACSIHTACQRINEASVCQYPTILDETSSAPLVNAGYHSKSASRVIKIGPQRRIGKIGQGTHELCIKCLSITG